MLHFRQRLNNTVGFTRSFGRNGRARTRVSGAVMKQFNDTIEREPRYDEHLT